MFRFVTATVVLSIVVLAAQPAAADYPERAVRVVVPSSPGSVPDVNMRVVAAALSQQTSKQFIVDNRPGGLGAIGFDIIVRAAPEGYTIGYGTSTSLSIYQAFMPAWPYQAGRDYQPVVWLTLTPFVLAVSVSLPVKSVAELIAHARDNPGRLLIASSGNGSAQHLSAALFQQMTGTQMPLIQYKGPQQGITDMIGGRVHAIFDGATAIGTHIKAGRVRGLAVTTAKRAAFFPELPTIAEAGVPDYVVTTWGGLIAPGGISKTILNRLNMETNKTLASAAVKENFAGLGAEPVGGTPEAFATLIRQEAQKWAAVIKAAGIKPE
jgi:tripartite-type tricarboxylate transporter receptor subunit TctC